MKIVGLVFGMTRPLNEIFIVIAVGDVDHPELFLIGHAARFLRHLPGLSQRGHEHCRKNGNDRNDHQKLDQGEVTTARPLLISPKKRGGGENHPTGLRVGETFTAALPIVMLPRTLRRILPCHDILPCHMSYLPC